MVLRTICSRTDKAYWTREEVLEFLPFLVPQRLYTALIRLRRFGLLRAASTIAHLRKFEITASGRAVVAALEVLKGFGDDEELRFGYVVTQLAGSEATGSVSPEVIDVCLSTVNSLIAKANEALELRSERLIEETHGELQRQWRWLEQAGQILERLADDPNMSTPVHRKAQQTGRVLATAQKLDSVLKRHGAEIAHQRERMTKSGLTGRMVTDWLRTLSANALCELAIGNAHSIPRPMLLNPLNGLDVAHSTLDRGRLVAVAPPPLPALVDDTERGDRSLDADNSEFRQFIDQLRAVDGRRSITEIVLVPGDFPRTALRLGTLVRAEASTIAHNKGAREAIFDDLHIELHPTDQAFLIPDSAVSNLTCGEVSINSGKGKP